MTLSEIGVIQFLQPASAGDHSRRQVTAINSDEESSKTKSHRQRGVPSPIQDQVTLSKEAQALATSRNHASKNHSFQQPSSPFDH